MYKSFNDHFFAILKETWLSDVVEYNARTKTNIKIMPGGTSFKIDLSDGLLPLVGFRKTFPKSAAAEVAWFLRGEQDVTFVKQYAPLWDKFVEADGVTVTAAYGYRWRKHFGRDQIDLAIDALISDPSNRRIFISAWDPSLDGLGVPNQKNVPCPAVFTLNIVNGQLHSSLFIRSSDVFVGLPYDIMGHALLMDAIVSELKQYIKVDLGTMQVTLAHPHLYEAHWPLAANMIVHEPSVIPRFSLPKWSLSQISADPHTYVRLVAKQAIECEWSKYNPRPEIIE